MSAYVKSRVQRVPIGARASAIGKERPLCQGSLRPVMLENAEIRAFLVQVLHPPGESDLLLLFAVQRKDAISFMSSCIYVSKLQHTSACVSIRQHTSAYVRIRQDTSAIARQHPAPNIETEGSQPDACRARLFFFLFSRFVFCSSSLAFVCLMRGLCVLVGWCWVVNVCNQKHPAKKMQKRNCLFTRNKYIILHVYTWLCKHKYVCTQISMHN